VSESQAGGAPLSATDSWEGGGEIYEGAMVKALPFQPATVVETTFSESGPTLRGALLDVDDPCVWRVRGNATEAMHLHKDCSRTSPSYS
jgi:hypothetical protein